jgi:integrase
MIIMGYFTGMGLEEILGLRWTNINLADGQVRLDDQKR